MLPRPAKDELDLYVVTWTAGHRVNGFGVGEIGRTDEVAAFVSCIDGEDANEDVYRIERVCKFVRKGPLFLAVRSPGSRGLVGRKDVVHEGGDGEGKGGEETQGKEDGERLGRHKGMA